MTKMKTKAKILQEIDELIKKAKEVEQKIRELSENDINSKDKHLALLLMFGAIDELETVDSYVKIDEN
jgi:hypothetical protein